MTSPFSPPTDTAVRVPPNRVKPASAKKTLLLWVVLIAMFAGIYAVLNESPHPRQQRAEPERVEVTEHHPAGWLVPLATYGAMVGILLAWRRRLPAKYRTGELREIAATKPEEPKPVPPEDLTPIDLTFLGTDGARPVRLTIDDRGLRWRAEERVLLPAQELGVPWDTLEAISTGRVVGGSLVWGIILALGALAFIPTNLPAALAGVAAGVGLAVLGKKTDRGSISFVTATHALTFQSKELDTRAQDLVMAAARARRPQAVRATPQGPQPSALRLLVVAPFVDLHAAFRSDAWCRAKLLREGSSFPDDETALAGMIQWRLFSLWKGVLMGAGPVSLALGSGIATGAAVMSVPAAFLAWVMGLVVLSRSTVAFARFSGMSVVR